MRRTHKALITLALGLALAGAAGVVAAAATPPTGTHDQAAQRKALSQSELDTTLARHHALGALGVQEPVAQHKGPYLPEAERTLARHRALGAIAAQPAARTAPAAPAPGPGVDVLATLLVGLVGGLLGGAGVMVGWTATTRRRRSRAAHAGT